jgi:NTP pyrophosphatase (non-canonical NTP hydrolase)
MSKFKVGDLVRCIDNTGCEDDLVLNAEYIVEFTDAAGISFDPKADYYDWYDYRFELVPPTVVGDRHLNINELCKEIHASNVKAGWWDAADNALVVPTKLALVHSELSEALESHRKNTKDDKLPQYDGIAVELADAVIRIFDLAGFLGIPLGTIMAEKEAFNAKREDHKVENRAKPQGKRY